MTDRLEVGRIAKVHGLRGEVLVVLTTDRLERVASGSQLYVDQELLVVAAARPHQNGWLVQFDSLRSREAAERYKGRTLTADPLDDPGVLWVHELIGQAVVELDGTERGVVASVQANPASDLLVLDSGALVPMAFITNHESGRVVIDPPEGLFDL